METPPVTQPYIVISADCHAGLESPGYREYLDPQYREAFDDELRQREELITAMRQNAFGNDDAMAGNEEFQEEWFGEEDEGGSLHEVGLRCGWDPKLRDKELSSDGVAGEVMFPGPDAVTGRAGAPFGAGFNIPSTADPELVLAGARAYNRWAAEMCQESPHRRAGLAVIPILADIDGAVAEIHRARESGVWGGIIIPAQWGTYPSYTNYRYDPVWAACEELEMPVHTHSGPGALEDYGAVPGTLGLYASETVWWTARPLWFMLWSGVFERFPGLKMAVTEAGSFWAPDLLWRWDSLLLRDQGSRKLGESVAGMLTMKPSEYFDRNCALGSSNTRRRELAKRYEIGVGNIMWGNDFPHPEGTWPYTKKILREAFWDVPVDETARMLGLNAAEFYGFDVERLRPIADEIGPTPEDLGQGDESVLAKWDDLRAAGRHWLTGREAVPAVVD
jgi:predicted TIM-barrel fold metal-dependent hydrolase